MGVLQRVSEGEAAPCKPVPGPLDLTGLVEFISTYLLLGFLSCATTTRKRAWKVTRLVSHPVRKWGTIARETFGRNKGSFFYQG